ncbi:MAG: histidine kinase N-terminal 7TM domain-containing protein [Halobacteriales archaeon]
MLDTQFVGAIQIAAGGVSLALLKPGLDNQDTPGSGGYALITIGIALWMVGLSVPNLLSNYTLASNSINVVVLGVELTAAGWLLLALAVTDRASLTRRVAVVLGAAILLSQLVFWTNSLHGLAYEAQPGVEQAFESGERMYGSELIEYGGGFWAHAAASYLCALAGETLLVVEGIRSRGLRRKQLFLLSLAAVPVIVGSVISTWGLFEVPHNVTPFGYLLAVPILAAVLFRTQFLDIVPVARRTAVSEMDAAMISLDDENRVVDANRRARELFGSDPGYVGTPADAFFSAVPDEPRSRLVSATEANFEFAATLAGERRHFSAAISPVSERGEWGRTVLLHEITARKQNERHLQRQNDRLEEFASIVSHDLRNPLNVAIGNVQLAKETGDVDRLDDVSDAHERMEAMIENLLTMARADTVVDDTEEIELKRLVTESWGTTRTDDATLEMALDGAVVTGDPDLLRNVFENLFRNAVEHNDDPVAVTVGLLPDAGGFYVADDGSGIPTEDRERVLDHGYSTGEGGTGLGLSIVDELAKAHGWSVTVTGSNAGGARFEFTGVEIGT